MIRNRFALQESRVGGLAESDKLSGDDPTLVHELVEGVLAIGARLAEDNFLSIHK